MDGKFIVSVIYLAIMIISAVVLATVDVFVYRWQYWVITFCVAGAYICGILRGCLK